MENHLLEFCKENSSDMKAFAQITAEWVRQGVTYTVAQSYTHIQLKLTGGY